MNLRLITSLTLITIIGLCVVGCSGSGEETAAPTPPAAAAKPAEGNPNQTTQVAPSAPPSAL